MNQPAKWMVATILILLVILTSSAINRIYHNQIEEKYSGKVE